MTDRLHIERVTSEALAHSVPRRWRSQYRNWDGTWKGAMDGSGEDVYLALCAHAVLTPAIVNSIIGNDSWTTIRCDVCGERVACAVRATGEEIDGVIEICAACLGEMRAVLGAP